MKWINLVKIVVLDIFVWTPADTSSPKLSATTAGLAEGSTSRPTSVATTTLPSEVFMTTSKDSSTKGN